MQRFCSSHVSKNWKFLLFFIFLNVHPKFLIILEILTTKMAQKHAQKVQKIAKPRGFLSRILHFDVTAYVSQKQKCRRKNIGKSF